MSMPMQRLATFDDYLQGELSTEVKSEYIGGHTRLMTGGSIAHARMIHRLAVAVDPASRVHGCEVFTSDAMLRIGDTVAYYPDLMVCCDAGDDDDDYRSSPCLIAEVLSPSTRRTDKTEKVAVYELMPSLLAFLLVNPDEPWIELHVRSAGGGWKRTTHGPGGVLDLPCPKGLTIEVDDLYV